MVEAGNRIALLLVLPVCCAWSGIFVGQAVYAGKTCEKGWVLFQNNVYSLDSGTQTLTMSKSAIKFATPNLSVYVTGPGKPLGIYSSATKEFVEQPYEQWVKQFGVDPKAPTSRVWEMGKDSITIAGLRTRQELQYMNWPPGQHNLKKVVWLAKDIHLPANIANATRALCGMPSGDGIPLRFVQVTKDGKERHVLLDTLKAQQQDIPLSTFKRPVGFKRASSEMTLIMHNKRIDAAKIFDDMGR